MTHGAGPIRQVKLHEYWIERWMTEYYIKYLGLWQGLRNVEKDVHVV